MSKIYKFKLNLKPLSVNTLWINKPKGRYKSAEGKAFEEEAKWLLKQQFKNNELLKKQLIVRIIFIFKNNVRRDVDNFAKCTLDAMTNIIYKDDSQIKVLILEKEISNFNSIEIEIEELETKQ